MHLRVNTTRRGSKIYQYAQLVQSVRDKNGKSTTKVIKHLGLLPDMVIDALRLSLKAGALGERIFVQHEVSELLSGHSVASRRFLDLAALIECWRQWDMSSMFQSIVPPTNSEMSFEQVVLCLVLQRCCEPGSKFGATRWVPRTALPQLLGFDLRSFNNSRIHRALELLHQVTPALQDKLVKAYQKHDDDFGVLFMDVTDTYFEGMGCPLAEQTRTKTEMPNKRCIAIVMLVNKYGYPLRWELVGGKTKDWVAMQEMLQQIEDVPWIGKTPIVFDRAMGNRCNVEQLKEAGLWFLTAAHRTAIESYTLDIPVETFKDVKLTGTDDSYERDINAVAQAARDADFEEVNGRLFVRDLGVVETPSTDYASKYKPRETWRGQPNKLAENLRLAKKIQQVRQNTPKLTQSMIAQLLNITTSKVARALTLLRLCPYVQQEIEKRKERFPVPENDIRTLFNLRPDEQKKGLTELLAKHETIKKALKDKLKQRSANENPLKLRLVAYFNPQLFVDTRRRAVGHCELLRKHVVAFNQELASAKKSREREPTYRKFSRELERLNYLDTFKIELNPIDIASASGKKIKSFQGDFIRDDTCWQRRRKYDGFVLLLAHPDLPHSAAQLAGFYRGKDVVEKGFQTIKSFVRLRPIFHYTDPKVKSHVTICMLALMLRRTLRQRINCTELNLTEAATLEILADCRLEERITESGLTVNHPTKLNSTQERILSLLNFEHIVTHDYLVP